jgi:hypothetical protein
LYVLLFYGDFDSYRQLTDVVWETVFRHDDVDITNTILNIADNTIPNRFITVQKDSRPWITTRVKITIVVKKYFPFVA